jgi:uncharacterized protein YaaQ
MKLVMATVQDQDVDGVLDAFRAQRIGVTRVGTTGGFLQQGNSTLLIGVQESQLEVVFAELRRNCKRRTQFTPIAHGGTPGPEGLYNYLEVEVGGAVVFVLDVDRFEQI